jgi:hypothetical protein
MTRRLVERFQSGLRSLRRNGVVSTAFAVAQRVGVTPHGQYYYHRARLRAPGGPASVEPFRTLAVDPEAIEWLSTGRFDKWGNLGEVRDGSWDEPLMRFDATPTFRTLRQRYVEGKDWEETELYRNGLARLWRGKRGWHGSWTEAELKQRCKSVDDLYERLSSEGYRSQAELTGEPTAERLRQGEFKRYESDIAVHIARDGSFRFVDGRHRLALAKLLGLDSVTVQPVVRHQQWQQARRRVAENGVDAVSPELRHHADLLDVQE